MAAKDYWRFRKIPWKKEEKFLAGREVAAAQRSEFGWTFIADKAGSPKTLWSGGQEDRSRK